MTYETAIRGGIGAGLVLVAAWACAGGDTPTRTEQILEAIAQGYAGSTAMPSRGGSGPVAANGGDSGSGPDGNGGATSNAGSSGSNQGGSDDPPPAGSGPGGDTCNAPEVVFQVKCGGESGFCHGTGSLNGDFAVSAAAAAGVVDQESANGAACGLLIDSGNSDNSLILTKVTGTFDDNDCGPDRMPLGDPNPLPEEEVDCIRDWLTQFED